MSKNTLRLRIAAAFITCALLGACGQRGALYLPDESRNVVVTPAQSPAPAASPAPVASPAPAATAAPAVSPAPANAAANPDATEEQRRNSTPPAK